MEELNIYADLNKLYLTFSPKPTLDETLDIIIRRYSILYNKIFILESPSTEELICTYNIDGGNVVEGLIQNTILVHRKKDTNTLYSINGLNALVTLLNCKPDKNYQVPWKEYRNCILLTNGVDQSLRKLETKIHNVIEL
jgi:hypothetical protein